MPIVVVLAMSNVSALTEEFQALDRAISRFIPTLIPAHQLDATLLHDKHALIVIHSLANAAMIHLCYRFSQEDPVLYEKSLRAAHACVNIIKHIADADFNFLDPIIGVSALGVPVVKVGLIPDTFTFHSLAGTVLRRSLCGSCATGRPRGPFPTQRTLETN